MRSLTLLSRLCSAGRYSIGIGCPDLVKLTQYFLWILKLCLVKEKIKDKLTVFLSSISKIENSNNKNMWCSEWAKGLILLQTKMLRFVNETNIF